uniref:Uncharacterized protein n=1 Tax=Ananas comosus var. bracteatus TaxID=296719 RepID=A0A6V7P8T1_ANACO|nr:unnamed protein product [Ananas comosus var. bracteatus]
MALTFLVSEENMSIGDVRYFWILLQDARASRHGLRGTCGEGKVVLFQNTSSIRTYHGGSQGSDSEGGLFDVSRAQFFESSWDQFDDFVLDNVQSGANVAKSIRAVAEPIISSHFGRAYLMSFFSRYANNIARHLSKGKAKYHVLVFALKRKE